MSTEHSPMDIGKFAATPLAQSLHAKYGWGLEEWIKIERYARSRYAMSEKMHGQSPDNRGRAHAKILKAMASEFGASADELVLIDRWERSTSPHAVGMLPKKISDLIYAYNIIDSVVTSRKDAGLAKVSIDDANRDAVGVMLDS